MDSSIITQDSGANGWFVSFKDSRFIAELKGRRESNFIQPLYDWFPRKILACQQFDVLRLERHYRIFKLK
ncbi:hypothetical protein OUZ56_016558 [Daphnia magna]|uniref:Uncharacterized protein n=1 Tax=Daphnia magna TaxID=35525 RepID=A0ABR0AQX4_9CRUS|nr:hypothetical protein OUZ56_016558 [Daphnia magna]